MSMVFAETTALAYRALGTNRQRRMAEAALSRGAICTSTFVLNELRCTFVYDAVTLLDCLLVTDTVADALLELKEQYTGTRHQGRSWDVFCLMLTLEPVAHDRNAAIEALGNLVYGGLETVFLRGVAPDSISDKTGCGRAEGVVADEVGYRYAYRCRKSDPPKCVVASFLRAVAGDIGSLLECQRVREALPAETCEWLATAIDSPDECRGEGCSYHLADALILLEAPPEAAMCTANVEHFEPMCACLGREIVDINPPRSSRRRAVR